MISYSKIAKAFHFCRNAYARQLLLSNTLSTMALLGIGDFLTQTVEIRMKYKNSATQNRTYWDKYDWMRTARVTAIGIVTGPMGHYWYDFLDRKYPTRTIYSILHKVLYDQILAAPVFNIVFIFGIHFLETKNLQEIIDAVKSKFLIIYTYDCSFWPTIQIINFYFISNTFRLLYINTLSLIWNSWLSYIVFNHDNDNQKKKEESLTNSNKK